MVEGTGSGVGGIVDWPESAPAPVGTVVAVSGGHTGGGSGGFANPVAVHAERTSDTEAMPRTTLPTPDRRWGKGGTGEVSTGATSVGGTQSSVPTWGSMSTLWTAGSLQVVGRCEESPVRTPYETLKETSLFSGLSWEQCRNVVDRSTMHKLHAGQVVIDAGAAGEDSMWVVLEGSVDIMVAGTTVATYGAGEYVGELAVLSDAPVPRSADVVVRGEVTALEITRDDLEALIAEEPRIALAMLAELARRLRKTTNLLAAAESEAAPHLEHLGPIEYPAE